MVPVKYKKVSPGKNDGVEGFFDNLKSYLLSLPPVFHITGRVYSWPKGFPASRNFPDSGKRL
jgi:hypothetical protein